MRLSTAAADLAIFLRGRLDTVVISSRVREHLQSIDRELPVFSAETLDDALLRSLIQPRFSMELVGLFAFTALLLAVIGIYGVISYIVSERRHEIGIRLALGAEGKNILRMVLRQGLRLAFAGAIIGLAGAFIVSRLMAHLLYDVHPNDRDYLFCRRHPLHWRCLAGVLLPGFARNKSRSNDRSSRFVSVSLSPTSVRRDTVSLFLGGEREGKKKKLAGVSSTIRRSRCRAGF